jgi:hypothetical protein
MEAAKLHRTMVATRGRGRAGPAPVSRGLDLGSSSRLNQAHPPPPTSRILVKVPRHACRTWRTSAWLSSAGSRAKGARSSRRCAHAHCTSVTSRLNMSAHRAGHSPMCALHHAVFIHEVRRPSPLPRMRDRAMAAARLHLCAQPRALDREASLTSRACLKGTQSHPATPPGARDLDLGSRFAGQGVSLNLEHRKKGQHGARDLGPYKQPAPTPTPSTAKVPPQTRTPPSPRDLDLGSRFLGQGASLDMRSSQGGQQAALDLVRPCTCS